MHRRALRIELAYVGCLLLAGSLLFFYQLGDRELTSSHEARAAQNARSILSDDAWALPRLFDRHIELQKPPFYYWLVAAFAWMRGGHVDAWAVRLPAALSALGCVLFVYIFGCCRNRSQAGFLAALMLATSLHFTTLGRTGRIDMPLTLAISLALGSFFLGRCCQRERAKSGWQWFVLGYASIGAGLLLKGPIALVLPAAACVAFLLVESLLARRWPGIETPNGRCRFVGTLWWGVPLILAIAGPWFIWANIETQNRLWNEFVWHHNLQRGFGGSEALASHPFWFYLPRMLLDMLPWILLAPLALVYFFRSRRWQSEPEARFGLIWFATMLGFLSVMRFKRADYLLPAYPGAALWLGCIADRWFLERAAVSNSRPLWQAWLSPKAFGGVAAICLVAWIGYTAIIEPQRERSRGYRRFAEEIRQRTASPVIFFRAEAHELAFHVGPPIDTILEWENLDIWATSPDNIYFVMPPECADEWPMHLERGMLEKVLASTDLVQASRDRPLILMRSIPRRTENR